MFIQKDLTVTYYAIENITWELSDELLSKLALYKGFSILVFDSNETEIVDIVEDLEKKQQYALTAQKRQDEILLKRQSRLEAKRKRVSLKEQRFSDIELSLIENGQLVTELELLQLEG